MSFVIKYVPKQLSEMNWKIQIKRQGVVCSLDNWEYKELAFTGKAFLIGKKMVLSAKTQSLQHRLRSSVGRAPLLSLNGTREHTLATVGVQVQILSWLNTFWSLSNGSRRKTEQDQLYNFARFYHSRTSDKVSRNDLLLKMHKVALIFS